MQLLGSLVRYNDRIICLRDVLEYLTGGDYIPFGGLDKIKVYFYNATFTPHSEKAVFCNKLPTVKTCSLTLNLPRNFQSYDDFQKTLSFCIFECKNFGDY